jgi:hypothetical protein
MSLESIIASAEYLGTGSPGAEFPITFQFLSPTHIQVSVRDPAHVETPLPVDRFTVTATADHTDGVFGKVTTFDAWSVTHKVVISRVTPTLQPMVLENGALIQAKVLERAFDRLTMIAQETRGYSGKQEASLHAAQHADGGSDPITIAQLQVSGLTAALAAKATAQELAEHIASAPTQAALAAKADKLLTTHLRTGVSEVLALIDAGTMVAMNNSAANVLTVPAHSAAALPVGCQILVKQLGAGATTIAAASGVTIRSRGNLMTLAGRYAIGVLIKDEDNIWTFTGDRA